MAGQNIGLGEAQPAKTAPTAYEVKPVHRRLQEFTDDELKQSRILSAGSRLGQKACPLARERLQLRSPRTPDSPSWGGPL